MRLDHDHLVQAKLIVCVIKRGLANQLVKELYQKDKIVITEALAVRHQGATMLTADWVEMDMLKVIVLPQYADEVFRYIYYKGNIEHTESSYMFQMNVPWVSHFELPNLDTGDLKESDA